MIIFKYNNKQYSKEFLQFSSKYYKVILANELAYNKNTPIVKYILSEYKLKNIKELTNILVQCMKIINIKNINYLILDDSETVNKIYVANLYRFIDVGNASYRGIDIKHRLTRLFNNKLNTLYKLFLISGDSLWQ